MAEGLRSGGGRASTRAGVGFALGAAAVSGFSVWLNGQVVSRVEVFGDPGTYTTAKNLVAGAVVAAFALVLTARRSPHGFALPRARRQLWALVAVAVVGGSVPFLLFFEGLARSGAPGDAQLLHKAGLLVFVAVLGPALLRERLGALQVGGVVLVLAGYWMLSSGPDGATLGAGALLVLAASLCWAVESVIDRWLLADVSVATVGTFRLFGGVLVLLAIGAFNGDTAGLAEIGVVGWAWASLTGVVLAAYVGLWLHGLRGAQAVDVTAILTLAAPITALVALLVDGVAAPDPVGLVVIGCGAAVVAAVASWSPRRAALQGSGGV